MTLSTPAPTGSRLDYAEVILFRCTGCCTVRAVFKAAPDDVALGLRPCVSCGTADEQDFLVAKLDSTTQKVRFALAPRREGGLS